MSRPEPGHVEPSDGRYLIVNAYSARNAGDAAIVLATARVLRRLGASSIVSATRYHEQDRAYYERHGIEVAPPLIPFSPRSADSAAIARALEFAAGAVAMFALVALKQRRPRMSQRIARWLGLRGLHELQSADRVVVCGGGYLYSSRRTLNLTLVHVALTTKLADLAGRRPLMMPQSIGPLAKEIDRRLVSWAYKGVVPIVARDAIAVAQAREIMPERLDILLCPDIAFAGWEPDPPWRDVRDVARIVGIVVMDWTWARPGEPEHELAVYVDKLASVCRSLVEHGCEIRLFGHSRVPEMRQDDVQVAERVARAVGPCAAVVVDPGGVSGDADTMRATFARLDAVVGTRLHSCIISMVAGTPAIGLAYQPKTEGAYRLLGLEDLCVDVQHFDPRHVTELVLGIVSADPERRDAIAQRVRRMGERVDAFYAGLLEPAVSAR